MKERRQSPRKKLSTLRSLRQAMMSWRTASVSLLSFSSGLPLGLVWIAIPDWLRSQGVDLKTVGLITLSQAPWTFKMVWSPLMDRFVPPFWGRRRGWVAVAQVALLVLGLVLAGLGHHPETPWVVGAVALAMAFASATQDIALDAYAVDVLRPEEQGAVVGARVALYRAAMFISGGLSITLAAKWSWPVVNIALAVCFLPMIFVAWKAPEPERKIVPPRTLKEAAWKPFVGALSRHRALEILAFVLLYKLSDNLAGALLRPFLIDMGYSAADRGLAVATIGLAATLAGTFMGGFLTTIWGLGHSLWAFGFLQIFSNIGYIMVARSDVNRVLMFGATGFESLCTGLGTGAFSVLLLRITQRRFSATQYALFSSLFGLPRVFSGPIAGFFVDATSWEAFLWFSIAAGIPGLILLQRFAPVGVRDPVIRADDRPTARGGISKWMLALTGVVSGTAAFVFGGFCSAVLAGLKRMKDLGGFFDLLGPFSSVFLPSGLPGWLQFGGLVVFGAVVGVLAAAVYAARRGERADVADDG